MKKLTVFLSIMMLAIQALFAQLPQTPHWTVNPFQFQTNMVATSAIYIENVDVQNPYYELGAFCNDEVRGRALASIFPPTGKYVWLLMIYGNDGDQITFKVYDHQNKQELDLECHTTVTYHSNDVLGSAPVPYHVEFVNPAPATYTLTVNYSGAGEQTPQQHIEQLPAGETYYVPTPEVSGYIPDIFIVEGTMPDNDVTITVTYSVSQFEITAEADPEYGGTVAGAGTYTAGSEITLAAIPETGYDFINWTYDGEEVSTNASYTFVVDEQKLFVAHFEIRSCVVTVAANPDEGGIVEGGGTFTYGETATLTATADETFNFVNWTINDVEVSTETVYSFEVTSDVAVVANFEQVTYEVTATADPEPGGIITGTGAYLINSEATITASANPGYVFVNWTENDEVISEETSLTFAVESPRTFVAHFTQYQTIHLQKGNNYFSTYIEMQGAEGLEKLMAALGNKANMIKSQNAFTNYYEGYGWFGLLNEANNEEMYMINMNESADITIVGDIVDPANHPITIHKGSNWIGYLSTTDNLSVESALENITPANMDMIKSQTAFKQYFDGYGWFGQLNSLNVGKGYIYTSNSNENKTITYPNNRGEIAYNEETHWTPVDYDGKMYYYAVLKINDIDVNDDNYEIGAFVDGECRGAGTPIYFPPSSRFVYALQINGNEGEQVYFDIYDRDSGIEADYICMKDVCFTDGGSVGSLYEPDTFTFQDGGMIYVSASPIEGGTVKIGEDGGLYSRELKDTSVTVYANANADYEFVNWTENDSVVSTVPGYGFEVTTRRNLVANFNHTTNTFNIAIEEVPNGTILASHETAEPGTDVTISFSHEPGFCLYGLSVYRTSNPDEKVTVTNNTFIMPVFDVTITGIFLNDITEYGVAVSDYVNGEVVLNPDKGLYNTPVSVTATPAFSGFLEELYYTDDTGNHDIISTKTFNMPQCNVTLHPKFSLYGDSNDDDFVNVLDVVNTARKVLGQNPEQFKFICADVDRNNEINVNDVTGTANIAVQRGIAECYDYQGVYYIEDGMLNIETDVEVAGIQVELDAGTASFINLEGFTTGAAWVDGKYVMLAYSLDNTIEAGTHQIMQLGRANIKRIIVSTAEGCNVNMCNGHLNVTESEDTDIQIYPNPATNYIRIDGSNIEKVTVTNIIGQVVIEREIHSDNGVIDLGKLPDGTYLFRIMTTEGIFTKNVIIAK